MNAGLLQCKHSVLIEEKGSPRGCVTQRLMKKGSLYTPASLPNSARLQGGERVVGRGLLGNGHGGDCGGGRHGVDEAAGSWESQSDASFSLDLDGMWSYIGPMKSGYIHSAAAGLWWWWRTYARSG